MLDDALSALVSARSEQDIHDEFSRIAANHGFVRNSYVDIGNSREEQTPPYFITSLEDGFVTDYSKEDYFSHDAIFRRSCTMTVPFSWFQCPEYSQAQKYTRGRKNYSRKILELAYDYRFTDGMVVPAHSMDKHGNRQTSFISLYFEGDGERAEYGRPLPLDLRLICSLLHERMQILRGTERERYIHHNLSDRECECLLWASRGKTRSETSDILAISESSVSYYIKSAMKKLNVYNTTHAVAIAVRDGIIIP